MDNDAKKGTGYGKYPFLDDRGLPIERIIPVQWVRKDESPEKKRVIDFKRIVSMLIAIVALFVIVAFDIWNDISQDTIGLLDQNNVSGMCAFIDRTHEIYRGSHYLTEALEYFYDKTGVAPYVYITDTINGNDSPSFDEMTQYAANLYSWHIHDKSHVLILIQRNMGRYQVSTVVGEAATEILDEDAVGSLENSLLDSLRRSVSKEASISDGLKMAADQIARPKKKLINPIIAGFVTILAVLFLVVCFNVNRDSDSQT